MIKNKTFLYFFYIIILATIVLLSAYGPIAKYVLHVTGHNITELVGFQLGIGPTKLRYLKYLYVLAAFLSVFAFVATFEAKSWKVPLLSLCLVLLTSQSLWLWVNDSALAGGHKGWERFSIRAFQPVDYGQVFGRAPYRDSSIQTFTDFNEKVIERYTKNRGALASAWPGISEELRKALFFLNTVNGLWGLGNKLEPMSDAELLSGCVLRSEETGHKSVPKTKINYRVYIRSNIGCCSDFANFLHYLFDKNGYEAHLIGLPGHWMNEVRIDGEWWSFDAMVNYAVHSTWENLYSGPYKPKSIDAYVFPTASSFINNPKTFRDYGHHRQIAQLTWMANRTRPVTRYVDTTQWLEGRPWFKK